MARTTWVYKQEQCDPGTGVPKPGEKPYVGIMRDGKTVDEITDIQEGDPRAVEVSQRAREDRLVPSVKPSRKKE